MIVWSADGKREVEVEEITEGLIETWEDDEEPAFIVLEAAE